MEFIFADENMVFNVALTVMLAIAALEGVGTLIGLGLSQFLDSILPDFDFDTDLEIETATPMTSFLGWLNVGQVPLLILLIVFLASFGILGLVLQRILLNATGEMWSGGVLAFPVFVASLPCVSVFGGVLAKLFPKDETEAVSEDTFLGSTAIITLGESTVGNPTQAKITDRFGQDHYVMVEPENQGALLSQGQSIIIIGKEGAVYKAAENIN